MASRLFMFEEGKKKQFSKGENTIQLSYIEWVDSTCALQKEKYEKLCVSVICEYERKSCQQQNL